MTDMVDREPLALKDDLRWRRLLQHEVVCGTCGERHRGLFDLASAHPEFWEGPPAQQPNAAVLGQTNVLTEDFCIIEGRHFFIRCVLPIPIVGTDEVEFAYGVWSTLSEKNFGVYRDSFDSGAQASLGPWFGWFGNRLKGYPETRNLKCQVHPRDGRQRPWIELEATDHPLAVEQREGMTLERLLEVYALNGHDLRPALGMGPPAAPRRPRQAKPRPRPPQRAKPKTKPRPRRTPRSRPQARR